MCVINVTRPIVVIIIIIGLSNGAREAGGESVTGATCGTPSEAWTISAKDRFRVSSATGMSIFPFEVNVGALINFQAS